MSKPCPSCGALLDDALCSRCDLAWEGLSDFSEESSNADARIVGDLAGDWEEPSVIPGATARPDGQVEPLLLYVARDPGQELDPLAILIQGPGASRPHTPLEMAILRAVDGLSSVLEVSERSGLPDKDFVAAVLSLLEDGALQLGESDDSLATLLGEDPFGDGAYEEEEPSGIVLEEPVEAPVYIPPMLDPIEVPVATPPRADPRPPPSEAPRPAPRSEPASAPVSKSGPVTKSTPKLEQPKVEAKPVSRSAPKVEAKPIPRAETDPGLKRVPAPRAKSNLTSRVPQAQKLYEQAVRDQEVGNIISAEMNLKLALSFDRGNPIIVRRMRALAAPGMKGKRRTGDPAAAKLVEEAMKKEAENKIDDAILLLQESLLISEEPSTLNRLGVVLALRRKDFARGRELLKKAVVLDPHNSTYKANLEKITQHQKTVELKKKAKEGSGAFSFFKRKK